MKKARRASSEGEAGLQRAGSGAYGHSDGDCPAVTQATSFQCRIPAVAPAAAPESPQPAPFAAPAASGILQPAVSAAAAGPAATSDTSQTAAASAAAAAPAAPHFWQTAAAATDATRFGDPTAAAQIPVTSPMGSMPWMGPEDMDWCPSPPPLSPFDEPGMCEVEDMEWDVTPLISFVIPPLVW